MDQLEITGPDSIAALIGKQSGPTEWREVTQDMIDTFAELSGCSFSSTSGFRVIRLKCEEIVL